MIKGVDAARKRAAFLCALGECANVSLAAARAEVAKSWCFAQRRADPAFAAAWDAALATARAALAAAGAPVPKLRAADQRPLSEETVLTGTHGAGTLRLWRARENSFTRARQQAFLDALRATCNVRLAAARAGVRPTTAYRLRRECAAFREDWTGAIAEGRVHLEIALIGSALSLLSGDAPDGEDALSPPMAAPDITGMDARVAVTVLKMHGPGGQRRNNWRLAPADPDAARANILARTLAIRAAREAGRLSAEDQDG